MKANQPKAPIQATGAWVEEYKKEFARTTGKTTEVTRRGSWLHLSYSGSMVRMGMLPKYIATLKARPNFVPKDKPKTAVTLQMPADAAARLLAKFKADPEGFREHFKQFGIIEVKPA